MINSLRILIFFILSWYSICCHAANLVLQSSAFLSQTSIPKPYTCQGANDSPALRWFGAPKGTQSYVLIMEDLDATYHPWVHWILFNLPKTMDHLDKATDLPIYAIHGKNSWGEHGYRGPCPFQGVVHRYVFTLYALDVRLTVNSSVNKSDILNAMEGHILAQTKLIGLY